MPSIVEKQARHVVGTCFGYQTRRLARVVTRIYNDRLRALGLNLAEMNLMAAIAAHGSAQAARLGRAMELDKSTLSRNIGRLVARGWVDLRDHPDERGQLLALTPLGDKLLLQAVPVWEQAQAQARSVVAEAVLDLEVRNERP